MFRLFLIIFLIFSQFSLSSEKENSDPLEGLNRKTHAFNMTLDDWVIRPIAETYDFIIPDFVQIGFSNLFDKS